MASKSWWSWLKQFGAALCPKSAPRRRRGRSGQIRCRLCLESLENRLVPTTVWIGDSSAVEPGPQGTVNMNFPLARAGDLSAPLTVSYTTVAGTAQPDLDFTPASGTVTFAAGASTAVIAVPIFNHGVYNNPNLSFSVQLTGIVGSIQGGAISFANHVDFPTGGDPVAVAVGDLNGDGEPDIVVANVFDDTVSVLMNTTPPGADSPSFAPQQTFPVGEAPQAVALADVNGDGRPDIVVLISRNNDASVLVLLNTTTPGSLTASFAAPQTISTGDRPHALAVADINGDGKPDLVVANYGNSDAVSVLLNTTPPGATTCSFTAQSFFAGSAGYGPSYVVVADLNGDGKPDLVVADQYNTLAVLLNTTPTGAAIASFGPLQTILAGYSSGPLAVGDINGDGKPDLVFANHLNPGDFLSVLLNTTPSGATTASFAPQQNLPNTDDIDSLVLADLNGDGQPDLILGDGDADVVPVLLNTTPTGALVPGFGSVQTFATGNELNQYTAIRSVAVGDLNGDGLPDLIVPNYGANTVSVLLNTTPPIIDQSTATGTIIESDPRHDVVVYGTPGDDTLSVARTPGGGIGDITYTLNGGPPVPLSGVTSFAFNGLAGDDTLIVSLANGGPLIAGPGPIYFDGSTGNNTLSVDAAGQTVQAGPGTVTIGLQTIVFANVASTNLDNAVALGASAGPDTVDRATAFAGLTANERYVQALFLDELGRAGTQAELDYWADQLNGSTSEQTYVAYLIEHSEEACDHLVRSWYVNYLGRQPANGEEQGWVAALLAGQSEEQVLSALLGSAEFYNRAQTLVYTGTAEQRYVQALFQVLLNRSGSDAEATWGENALAQLGRQAVVLSFLTAPEFRTDQFTGYYEGLLHRPPDAAGLNFWVMSPFDMAGVRLGFEFSAEFFLDG